jgi:hypothetical protein
VTTARSVDVERLDLDHLATEDEEDAGRMAAWPRVA